jgi:hypothetical protein
MPLHRVTEGRTLEEGRPFVVALALAGACAAPAAPPVQAPQVSVSAPTPSTARPRPPEESAAPSDLPLLDVTVTARDPDDAHTDATDVEEIRRAITFALPRLRSCLARGDRELREPVAYDVTVTPGGTLRPVLEQQATPSHAARARASSCTEYDAYMGRCTRDDPPGAPPVAPDVSPAILDCLTGALSAVELRPSRLRVRVVVTKR